MHMTLRCKVHPEKYTHGLSFVELCPTGSRLVSPTSCGMASQIPNKSLSHDHFIKWKHFPRYWPCVRGIHRSPVNSLTQRPVTRSFDVFFDLRPNHAHYDVIVMGDRYRGIRVNISLESIRTGYIATAKQRTTHPIYISHFIIILVCQYFTGRMDSALTLRVGNKMADILLITCQIHSYQRQFW